MASMKSLISKGLLTLVESGMFEWLGASARSSNVPIFMLHRFEDVERGVSGHSIGLLRRALLWLQENNYNVISLDCLIDALDGKADLPKRAVVFTIDDGFIEQVELAAAVFEDFGYPVSIFLITAFSSEKSWPWDYQIEYILNKTAYERLSFSFGNESITVNLAADADTRKHATRRLRNVLKCLPFDEVTSHVQRIAYEANVDIDAPNLESYRPITWARARASESPRVRFGPHSEQHAILHWQSSEVSFREIFNSKSAVESELRYPLNIFCYPTGRKNIDFDLREMDIVKNLGMRAGLSVTPGYVNLTKHGAEEHRYCLPRFGFPSDMEHFIQLCSWIELMKEKLRGNV